MRPVVFLLHVAVLMAASASAIAQPASSPGAAADFVGRPVQSVVLVVDGQPTVDPALQALVETPVGQPLSMNAVRETLIHLFNMGRFQAIDVVADAAAGDRVALVYVMTPLNSITDIHFVGTLGVSEGDLRRLVTERFGKAPPVGRADAAARTLEQYLARRGFLRAFVQPSIAIRRDTGRTVLTFDVNAGTQARVGTVKVNGVPEVRRVAAQLGVETGRAYERDRVDERLTEYLQSLRKRGYYEAAGDHRATPRDGDAIVDVVVDVRPGPVVKLAFEGDPLPRNRVDELVPVAREGSVDEDLLEDSDRRIEDYFRELGYWRVDATHRREHADNLQTVTFTIDRGPRFVLGTIEISGNQTVSITDLQPLVVMEPGGPFVEGQFAGALDAMRALYLRQGFTNPAIDPAYLPAAEPAEPISVNVRIAIREGVQTRVGSVTFDGNQVMADRELQGVLKVAPGSIYYLPQVVAERDALLLHYLNNGYAATTVTLEPNFNADRSRVDLVYRITESPRIIVDHIILVGNTRTDSETIRRELEITEGEPLVLNDVIESQRKLAELGLFRRVRISEVPHGDEARRDIVVTVDEADRTTLAYGGGAEITQRTALNPDGTSDNRFLVAPRGSFEIGRRNLWGGNRSVSLFTRVSFRPRGESVESEDVNYGFNEYRVVGTYREIRALRRWADLGLQAFVEQAIRSSFNFNRRGVNAELQRRLSAVDRLSFRYNFGRTRRFDERIEESERLNIDRIFPQVRLSSFSFSAYRDTRNDPLDPTRGWLFGSDSELAGRAIGSQVGFAKTYLQAMGFRSLSVRHPIVFAAAARVGLARGFTQVVDGQLVEAELPASERFFGGGSTTVRGFELDRLGAPETISATGLPLGGNMVLVLNGELRTSLWKGIGVVGFLDAGNVFARPATFDASEIRVSPGFGLRYRSPLGPIRVDVGFKVRRRELSPGTFEGRTAFHISVGHAF